jgi:hypothetical protein
MRTASRMNRAYLGTPARVMESIGKFARSGDCRFQCIMHTNNGTEELPSPEDVFAGPAGSREASTTVLQETAAKVGQSCSRTRGGLTIRRSLTSCPTDPQAFYNTVVLESVRRSFSDSA